MFVEAGLHPQGSIDGINMLNKLLLFVKLGWPPQETSHDIHIFEECVTLTTTV